MPSDKDRLYVALYLRGGSPKMPGGEDKYHWSILVGPKIEVKNSSGTRFHAKNPPPVLGQKPWIYEERATSMMPTSQFLVRVLIAKVKSLDRTISILRNVPISEEMAEWNCVIWIRSALEMLDADKSALGTRTIGWNTVRDAALGFVEKKKSDHRFDGQGGFDMTTAATFDLLENRETIP